ncbi:MAG: YhbY family RNA-binding protein [Deltaproteobacteria bacterium]|nr:YhbY family RNA-binding protein [Deltaproteobacteria bacterium]
MVELAGFQRTYLRGLAHGRPALIHVGQRGISDRLLAELERCLDQHELVKLKFNSVKDHTAKRQLVAEIERLTQSECVGQVGHTAVLYRQQADPEKRVVELPRRRR